MPHKDKNEAKLWRQEYYSKAEVKEKSKQYHIKYQQNNKEQILAKKKEYYQKNKERIKYNVNARKRQRRIASFESFIDYIFQASSRRARCDDFAINITPEYLLQLLIEQNYKCKITGVQLEHTLNHIRSMSVDRIDGKFGYIIGNVQLVAKGINFAKNKHTNEEVLDFVKLIRENK